uniref:Olfactory receptor n=1 Tax=Sphenodon punctatus TaxID=8508 RepID=A0A8D0L1Y7_SPHPU
MEWGNSTTVTEFILLGLGQTPDVQLILLPLFLLFYAIVLPGNVLIIVTIRSDPQLDSPMYFFLANLAFLDICYCFITPPKMLADLSSKNKAISYGGCMSQLFFLHFLGAGEAFLLMAMAYDRYVAICRPLHYSVLVNKRICCLLVAGAWTGGFIHGIILFALIIQLPYCGPNVVDNFFCDVQQVVTLACMDTHKVKLLIFFNNGVVILMAFILLVISYTILLIRLWIHSPKGRSKAASTCISHIIVVFIMSCPAIYLYTLPLQTIPMEKMVAFFHTVIFPLMNPMIYTLRNKKIKNSMRNLVKRHLLFVGESK